MTTSSGWTETTIGEQATLQRGIDITRKDQRPGSVPVVSSGGIGSYHDTAHRDGPGVVLGRKGVVGSVWFVDKPYWPHDTTLWVRDFHGNDERFVYYFFKSIAPRIARMDVGSANPTLNRNHVHPIKIKWPPLPIQKAIAHILGTLDDKIELNRRMNETLEGMARAIFKSWFVDFDPVRAKMDGRQPPGMDADTAALFPDSFQHMPDGMIPSGWQFGPLSSVADVIMGTSPKGDTYNDTGIGTPLVNGPVEFGDYFPVKEKWTTAPARFSEDRDLIFCVRGSTTGRRIIADGVYCLGRGVCSIRAKNRRQAFINKTIDTEIARMLLGTTGSVFPNLSAPQIKGFRILLPPDSLVREFCRTVGPMQDKVEHNVKESIILANLRDTLLPKLLSGEFEIKDSQRIAGGIP